MQEQREADRVNTFEQDSEMEMTLEEYDDDTEDDDVSDDISSDVFWNFDQELLEGLVEIQEDAHPNPGVINNAEGGEESAYESEDDGRQNRGDGDLQPFEMEIPALHISRTRPMHFKKRSRRTCWNEEDRKKWRVKRSRSSENAFGPPKKRMKLSRSRSPSPDDL